MTNSNRALEPHDSSEPHRTRGDVLPLSLPPRGLSRVQAAAYIGVSTTKLDEMVADGRMPGPKEIDRRRVWDRLKLDEAFSALPDRDEINPFD